MPPCFRAWQDILQYYHTPYDGKGLRTTYASSLFLPAYSRRYSDKTHAQSRAVQPRIFRKRILQILTNYLTTIMHHMTHQKTNPIGQYIKCPERKQSQKPHASVSQPVDKFRFHTFLIPYYNSTIPCNAVPSSLKSPKRTGTT